MVHGHLGLGNLICKVEIGWSVVNRVSAKNEQKVHLACREVPGEFIDAGKGSAFFRVFDEFNRRTDSAELSVDQMNNRVHFWSEVLARRNEARPLVCQEVFDDGVDVF